jgi:hypothetical protein
MKALYILVLACITPSLVSAGALEDRMTAFVDTEARSKLSDPVIIDAINAANAANVALTPADVQALDEEWKAEVGKDGALITGIVDNAASAMLRDYVAASGGKVTEVILMDAQGLNVAVSDVTSDYWQGDEDKYQQTYLVGPDAFHVSEVDYDESTQTYQVQVSYTVTDPVTGQVLGAATIGLNAESF